MNRVSPYQFIKLAEALGCDKKFISSIFYDAKQLAAKQLPIFFSLNHFARVAGVPYKELHLIIERKIDPYFHFSIPKKNGTRRLISSPSSNLAKIQKLIKEEILDSNHVSSLMHDAVFSYRKGRSIVDNAKAHLSARWLIKIDIKDFFGSVFETAVFDFFLSLGYNRLLSFELARLTTWPTNFLSYENAKTPPACMSKYKFYISHAEKLGSLPQGALTSPQLSNLLFYIVDERFSELTAKYGAIYTRYADDLYFSCDSIDLALARELIKDVRGILYRFGYLINSQKTKIFSPGAKKIITGIVVTDGTVRLIKNLKTILRKIFFLPK